MTIQARTPVHETVQTKVRHIRTPAGMAEYHGNIGDPIVLHPRHHHDRVHADASGPAPKSDVRHVPSDFEGWSKFESASTGDVYYIGQYDGGWSVTDANDLELAHTGTRREALQAMHHLHVHPDQKPVDKPEPAPKAPPAPKPASKPSARARASRVTQTAGKTPSGRSRAGSGTGTAKKPVAAKPKKAPAAKKAPTPAWTLPKEMSESAAYGGGKFYMVKSTPEGGTATYGIDEPSKGKWRVFLGVKNRFESDGKRYPTKEAALKAAQAFHARRDNWSDTILNTGKRTPMRPGYHKATTAEREALKVPPGWRHVQVANDLKNAKFDFLGVDFAGKAQQHYSPLGTTAKEGVTWERIGRVMPALPKLDKQLAKDTSEVAAAVAIMRVLGMRVGGEAGDVGRVHKAYGTTSLSWSHNKGPKDHSKITIDKKKKTVRFVFSGKEGVHIDVTSDDPMLYAHMIRQEAKKADNGGRLFSEAVTPAATVAYIKKHLGITDAENRTLRTVRATSIAMVEIKTLGQTRIFDSEKALKREKLEVAALAAAVLGNRPQECLTSYINPEVFKNWTVQP